MHLNPMKLMQLKAHWDKFQKNHPKFPKFLEAASQSNIGEDSVIEISIKNPDGRVICTNLKVTQDDVELVRTLKDTMKH